MMATKSKVNPLNTMHTAGIFSDMTIDGPVVGTLVLIVDRAKNLPNRKTIGKQDPYCAARLGKEAKKTTTDIRGGQTPKWDQELRFTVHDSPDYYQLKLSVFNDDKRTDLIGESWIDLRDIILPGGGQNDQWQTLACKGKYAGEIRIEITYYDSRPKPEKPAAKPKPIAAAPDVDASPAPPQRAPVKRRPLPSNPGTDSTQSPKAAPDHVQTPPRGAQPHPSAPSFAPKQSPLQAVEYNAPTPPSRGSFQEHYLPASEEVYGAPAHHRQVPQGHRMLDNGDNYIAHEDDRHYQGEALAQAYELEPRAPYSHGQLTYEQPPPPMPHRRESPPDDDRPPPPPVHRVRNNSGGADNVHRNSLDMQQHKTTLSMPMRHDVLRSEAHRLSLPAPPPANAIMPSNYPGRPTYRPFDSAPDVIGKEAYSNESMQIAPPRHHSYDSTYDPTVRAMQPTVEDVPESWTPPNLRPGHSPPQEQQYDNGEYGQVSSPAPLNLGGRGSAASGQRHSPPPVQFQGQYASNDYGMSTSPGSSMVPRDPRMGAGQAHAGSYGGNGDPYMSHPGDMDLVRTQGSNTYALPPVPATLVPGVDPAVAQEISTRLQEDRKQERRYTQPAPMPVPTRGRQHSEPPHHYAAHASPHGHYASPVRSYGGSPAAYVSGGPSTPTGQPLPITYPVGPSTPPGIPPAPSPRDPSPNPNPKPNHTIKRKSVSPAPIPEGRRLSGVPFGPDSYDALNPTIASANDASEYTNAYGKIVTSDGREVDPSDHLPMDTWAPEPEPKQPKMKAIEAAPRPAGAQPMPSSTRRNIRVTVRPQSMQAPLTYATSDVDPAVSPGSGGRSRLQKKVHRVSAAPAPLPRAPSPHGPANAHQRNTTPPRALVRASTYDYENHAPAYGSGPLVPYGSSGPPIPAKVPLMSGGLGPAAGMGHSGRGMNDDSWALMEEMSRIDIGSGRARRHGGY